MPRTEHTIIGGNTQHSKVTPMKYYPLKTLSAAAATLLLLGVAAPAHAQEAPPTGATQSSTPPKTGDNTPGAVMGQHAKTEQDFAHLSPSSQAVLNGTPLGRVAAASSPIGSGVLGMDVSGWQPRIDWRSEYATGSRFAYIKATEGDGYTSSTYTSQTAGARGAGMYTGGYHFALPGKPGSNSARLQAQYFVANGGGWSADGRTLPGLLDVEYNPYSSLGNMCYDLTPQQMVNWVQAFVDEYRSLTGRYPAIYSTRGWWDTCTGNSTAFANLPFHIASYNGKSHPGPLPANLADYDIWQYSDAGPFSGDSNVFNGTNAQLADFSTNPRYRNASTRLVDPQPQYSLVGAIGQRYYATGGQNSYGLPTGNEQSAPYGGALQNFTSRKTIAWHPNVGTYSVYNPGAIGQKFYNNGGFSGWGYPAQDEQAFTLGGAKAWFINPVTGAQTAVYWNARNGAHTLNGRGAIFAAWRDGGGVYTYGYPLTDEQRIGSNGAYSTFRNGSGGVTGIYWSPVSGAHAINQNGGFYWYWRTHGFTEGMGYPVTDEAMGADGKVRIRFSSGVELTWTAQEGTRVVKR